MSITKVWIEEGCTLCELCTDTCPEVFEMGDDTAFVKEDADLEKYETEIRESADGCPVEVIQIEEK